MYGKQPLLSSFIDISCCKHGANICSMIRAINVNLVLPNRNIFYLSFLSAMEIGEKASFVPAEIII